MKKLIRITTVPISLEKLLENQLRFMSDYYSVMAISADEENLKKVGKLQGVDVFHIEMTRKITPLKDLIAVWKLFLFLRKEKPLIVHSHTPKAGIVAMIAAKLACVPNRLHTVAGLPLLEATGKKRSLLDFVEKATYACATAVYPNSYGLYDIILKNKYTTKSKLKVLGNGSSNGIDMNYFNADLFSENEKQDLRNKLGVKPTDFTFIFVGRLVSDKGINELIIAFRKLSSENYNLKLLLVGSLEPDLDPLNPETIQEINSNTNIISVGFQRDVRPYFAISQVLAFPSYREGFPNVVMQAGAMGLASIVSNINGCNEIIIEGKNGTVIPVKSSESIYYAMKKNVENDEFRINLQKNARQMIASRYEQDKVWSAILDEYKRLEQNV